MIRGTDCVVLHIEDARALVEAIKPRTREELHFLQHRHGKAFTAIYALDSMVKDHDEARASVTDVEAR